MTPELAEILKEIVLQLHREAGTAWCSQMIDKINAVAFPKQSNPTT